MAPPKFGDFSKAANDLLNNDYCFDKKFKVKTKTGNGYEITSEGAMKRVSNSVSGKLTAKIPFSNGIVLNKVGMTHDGRFIADASYSNVIKGLSLSTLVEDGGKGSPVGEIGATYKHDIFTASLKVDAMNGPTLKDSISAKYENILVGGEFKYDTGIDKKGKGAGLKDFSLGASIVENDFVCSAKALKKLTEFEIGVHHKVSGDVELGAVYNKGKTHNLSFGGIYRPDKLTTIQGKVDSTGTVFVNHHVKVTNSLKLITSAQVNATNLAADTHKFGIQLHLS